VCVGIVPKGFLGLNLALGSSVAKLSTSVALPGSAASAVGSSPTFPVSARASGGVLRTRRNDSKYARKFFNLTSPTSWVCAHRAFSADFQATRRLLQGPEQQKFS